MKRNMTIVAVSLFGLWGISAAQAFDSTHFGAVKKGQKDCTKCDLTGADLRDTDLTNVNLEGADLTGAELTGARMDGAKISGAIFKSARLDEVDLTKVDLQDAILDKAWCGMSTKVPNSAAWSCVGVVFERR